jgi:hypothetical protein
MSTNDPNMQPEGCAKSRAVAKLGLRPLSASRTSGVPDLESLVRVQFEDPCRTVDRFPPVTPADFACKPSVWRRWRGWLR